MLIEQKNCPRTARKTRKPLQKNSGGGCNLAVAEHKTRFVPQKDPGLYHYQNSFSFFSCFSWTNFSAVNGRQPRRIGNTVLPTINGFVRSFRGQILGRNG
jgi:hypothetical protein